MRAIVCPRYGGPDVLELREVEQPRPKDDEVCVRIMATAVTASDIFIRGSDVPLRFRIPMRLMIGIRRPRRPVIGLVLAGEIAAVGRNAERFRPGDQVYGVTGFGLGAYAEYKCMKETDSTHGCLALKPANLHVRGGDRGGLRRAAGAAVHGQGRHPARPESARLRGLEHVGYDGGAVGEASRGGGHGGLQHGQSGTGEVTGRGHRHRLHPGRRPRARRQVRLRARRGRQGEDVEVKESCRASVSGKHGYVSIDDGSLRLDSGRLTAMKELVRRGTSGRSWTGVYPLEEMAEAHRYVGRGHKRGGVAVTVGRRQD